MSIQAEVEALDKKIEKYIKEADDAQSYAKGLQKKKALLSAISEREYRDAMNWYKTQCGLYINRIEELGRDMAIWLCHGGGGPSSVIVIVNLYRQYNAVAEICTFTRSK